MEEQEELQEVNQEQQENQIDESKFESAGDDSVIKVDLSQPPPVKKEVTEEPVVEAQAETTEEVVEEVVEQSTVETEAPILEEVTQEQVDEVEEQVEEAIAEAQATGKPLPENVQKLVDFIDETGGDINDYVNLNKDYSEMDNLTALKEYYKKSKPHLDREEANFLIEDQFKYDEELDDEKEIRKKKIALKEQVAEAKAYLDGQKSKYYEDIKAGSKLTGEQQNAIDFFNRYNEKNEEDTKAQSALKEKFLNKTEKVFNDKFKGFEYNVGEKQFRFNVKNAGEVKDTQSDINNFVKKFLNEDGTMSDAKGYHKSLYTAMNSDAIANHFYEQGKADALKASVENAKNVDMTPRQGHNTFEAGGVKFKVLGEDSATFKFKGKRK